MSINHNDHHNTLPLNLMILMYGYVAMMMTARSLWCWFDCWCWSADKKTIRTVIIFHSLWLFIVRGEIVLLGPPAECDQLPLVDSSWSGVPLLCHRGERVWLHLYSTSWWVNAACSTTILSTVLLAIAFHTSILLYIRAIFISSFLSCDFSNLYF